MTADTTADPAWVNAVAKALDDLNVDGWIAVPDRQTGEPVQERVPVDYIATAAVLALVPLIADAIEAQGREVVKWLSEHAEDKTDRARLIGTEDAYKDAIRIVNCEKWTVEP